MFYCKKIIFLVLVGIALLLMFALPTSAETVAPVEVLELTGYTLEENLYYSGAVPGSCIGKMFKGLAITDTYKVYDGNVQITDTENTRIKTGLTLKNITDGTECTVVLKGDINGDGRVTSFDYIKTKLSIVKSDALTGAAKNAADFNSDGSVTSADYMIIKTVFESLDLYKQARTSATKINLDIIDGMDISKYFTNALNCSATYQIDSSEGGVIKLTTSGVSGAGTTTPKIVFRYSDFVNDLGHAMPAISSNKYMVLKIKGDSELWSRTFSASGGNTASAARSGVASYAYIPQNDGWNYIYMQMSSSATVTLFDFAFESAAGGNNESVYISEIYLLSNKTEALEMCKDTVYYPVNAQTANDYSLKILNYNIQTEFGNPVNMSVRADMLREQLETLQPDSVGLQEVTNTWRSWLTNYVFNGSYAGVGKDRTTGDEANMIFYRKDKFQLVRSGTFWLSDTPDVAGSHFSGAEYVRICTWVRLKDKTTGLEYVHLNTHLDTSTATIRNKQVKVILKYAIDNFARLPMVLTGDFNQKSSGAFYKSVTGATSFDGYTASFADSRVDATVTVSADPIDYVFYTDDYMKANLYKRFSVTRDGYALSDHPAIYTEFKLK